MRWCRARWGWRWCQWITIYLIIWFGHNRFKTLRNWSRCWHSWWHRWWLQKYLIRNILFFWRLMYRLNLEFLRSTSFTMQFTAEASKWMLAGILCFLLPHAKPPDTYDKCTIILRKMQGITLASCPRITVTKFKPPCSGICSQQHEISWFNPWLVAPIFQKK